MFKDLGINVRVLLLTLLPSSLLALGLGVYFTGIQLSEMNSQLRQRGQMIAEQLVALAARPLSSRDEALLLRIATQTLDQPDVRAVSFLSSSREPLAHAGPRMISPEPIADTSLPALHQGADATRFLLPVYGQHRRLSGASPAAEDQQLLGWVELELSHQGTQLRGYRSLFASLLLVIAALAGVGLLALRMGRSISQPLQQIRQHVALLKDGHLDTRLPELGSPELNELAAVINHMAASLESARDELQQSIEQATEDVRQNLETIEIQNIELDMARREALEASRIKSEFLANMSHEIRTPLNGILGFANLLQKSELSPRQQDYLATISKSANSLLSIINEILDFSKIEAGKLMLESIPFNLRDLLEDTLTILAPTAHEKSLELVCLVYRDTPPTLIGDPLRLKQVLTNLVSNAIKFTHQGSVVLRAMLEDQDTSHAQLRISIQDTGIGLSETDRLSLFQAFSQADNSLARQTGGTGLGLAISKHLIEQMGGEIGLESTPGEGSEFWISLRLPVAHDDEEGPRAPLLGARAVVYEAHPLARQALCHQLEDCGLQVTGFDDCDALLQSLASQPAELALLGVTEAGLPPAQLKERLAELEGCGCRCMVLCPTTEQPLYYEELPERHAQLQAKPPCTRKLRQALTALLGQPIGSQLASEDEDADSPPRVLCVDDNPANLLLVRTLLEDLGARVCAVDSGPAALAAFAEQPFDLVFMDVQMPGMDGRQATEEIRRRELASGSGHVPIVALTAHALSNERRALLQAGMDDYVTKPISERQLAQVVLKWTGLRLRNTPPPSEPAAAPNSLQILDPQEGLRLAAGKADLAQDMLQMLLASLDADREAIRQARREGDRPALIERIHRLHGASRYCGVPRLKAACQRAETLLKQNDPGAEQAVDALDVAISELQETASRRDSPALSPSC